MVKGTGIKIVLTGRTKELRVTTLLDLGSLLPEIMWIPIAAIKEEEAVSLAYTI